MFLFHEGTRGLHSSSRKQEEAEINKPKFLLRKIQTACACIQETQLAGRGGWGFPFFPTLILVSIKMCRTAKSDRRTAPVSPNCTALDVKTESQNLSFVFQRRGTFKPRATRNRESPQKMSQRLSASPSPGVSPSVQGHNTNKDAERKPQCL